MILVTGGAGKTGRAIIQRLLARDQPLRALVRRQEQAMMLEQLGVRETFIGDMSDQVVINHAAVGASAIYHICPNMHPQETVIGAIVIRAALSAGVERFVYHSVLHPQIEAMAHHWQKLRVEEKLLESGLAFTILQPAAYMQNVLANWERISSEGLYAVPYAPETRLSMVDLQDVAAAAAVVLTEAGHEGSVYELSGAEFLSQTEIAMILAETLGRPVSGETTAREVWERQARAAGLNDYAVETLLAMFLHYEQYGFRGNPLVLGCLLGRSPTSFAQFLRRTLAETKSGG